MNDYPKIHINDLHVGVRPEEIDSIFALRNSFNYLEIIENYVSSYLELDWMVKLVIPSLDIALDVDFRQGREVWHQGLTDLTVKGIQTSLMVCTGSASNLMVLEVHGNNSEKALMFGRDWRARCVMQMGEDREQHFFTWPQALRLPNKKILETTDILVYGEGAKITLPPSLIHGAEGSIHWLAPPWENPPSSPTPRLMEFLEGHFLKETENRQTDPDIPAWEEILAQIGSHGPLMERLLTPEADAESYYQMLLKVARAAGLTDQRLLLGLLWHAPMGTARHDSSSLAWLQDLIKENDQGKTSAIQIQKLAGLIKELSRTLANLNKDREEIVKNNFNLPCSPPVLPEQLRLENQSRSILPRSSALTPGTQTSPGALPGVGAATEKSSLFLLNPTMLPQGEIPVNRKQYEAMIYELGRLNALQKFNNQVSREAKLLKAKIDAQRQEEINHLRQLAVQKKPKKWW